MIKNVGRWFAVITMIEVSRFLNGRCYDVWNCIYLSKNPQRHIVVAIRRFCETRYRTDGRSKNFGGTVLVPGSFERKGFAFNIINKKDVQSLHLDCETIFNIVNMIKLSGSNNLDQFSYQFSNQFSYQFSNQLYIKITDS